MVHGSSLPRRKRRGPRFSWFEGRREAGGKQLPRSLPTCDPTARFIGAPRTNGNDIPSGWQRETSFRSIRVRVREVEKVFGIFYKEGKSLEF